MTRSEDGTAERSELPLAHAAALWGSAAGLAFAALPAAVGVFASTRVWNAALAVLVAFELGMCERRLGIRLFPVYGSRSLLTAPLFTLIAAALGTGAAGVTVGPASAVLFTLAERLEPRLPRRADEALL